MSQSSSRFLICLSRCHLIMSCCSLTICCFLTSAALLAQPPDSAGRDEIKRWVTDLVSPNYSKRELASEQLKRLAGQSLELILEELEAADGEAHSRLLTLITDLATNPESPVSKPAFQGLLKLSTRTSGAKSLQIKQVVGSIQTEVARLAWYRYKRKSKNIETTFPSRSNPTYAVANPVVIDATFTGTYEDLN